jgi:hypothetical protein
MVTVCGRLTVSAMGEMRDAPGLQLEALPDPAPAGMGGKSVAARSLRIFKSIRGGLWKILVGPFGKHRMPRAARRGAPCIHFCGWRLCGCGLRRKLTSGPTAARGAVLEC